MPKAIFVTADESRMELKIPSGQNPMHAAIDAGIVGDCGGSLACHVLIVDQVYLARVG